MALSRRSFISMGATSLMSLALFGCGSSKTASGDAAATTSQDASGAFPVTIEHAYGSTTIESKPERVVCISWNNMEPPLALGVAPVGFSKPNYGKVDEKGMWPWLTQAYDELGAEYPVLFDDTDGVDLEAVNDCQPDIILAVYSGLTEDDYNSLSEIAPVVPFPEVAYQTYWREQTEIEGKAIGLEDEAKQLVSETEDLIKSKVEEYGTSGVKGAMLMLGATDLSTFYVYLDTDPRASYLIDLGVELPDSVKELAKSADPSEFALTLSSEQADQFSDLEVAVMYGDEALLAQAQADPLLSTIPAIAKGAVALLPEDSYLPAQSNPSVLGIKAGIDDYLKLLQAAVGKAKA